MISAFVNSFKIPDLRDRIIKTLFLLFIARVGANVPLPGLDPQPLQDFFAAQSNGSSGLLGLYNMFTGGALLKGAVFALGIMPYISASIVFQLLTPVVPSLARLQKEGEVGRQKLNQYTRYATVAICVIQGALLILTLENPGRLFQGYDIQTYGSIVLLSNSWFLLTSTVLLTVGTILLMWIGEQITQRGIGNGISILITVGILADLPGAVSLLYQQFNAPVGADSSMGLAQGIIMLILFFAVICGIIMVTEATRKIPVQHAKRVVGRKVYGGGSSFLPLKINYAGVMPVIFASAVLLFFQQIFSWVGSAFNLDFMLDVGLSAQRGHIGYYVIFGGLIFVLSYVWVSLMFKPVQIADDLKKNGGYIPGVRPGEPTARFLDFTMTRLTLVGSIFLLVIAVFPDVLLYKMGINYRIAQFFGGTGMLIVVGVLLDFLRQVETFLLQRHYDGFTRKGRNRNRANSRAHKMLDTSGIEKASKLWFWILIMLVVGLAAWGVNMYVFGK
jgi:preprotein translocase subunit SecY